MGAIMTLLCYCNTGSVILKLMNLQKCHHDDIQCQSEPKGFEIKNHNEIDVYFRILKGAYGNKLPYIVQVMKLVS